MLDSSHLDIYAVDRGVAKSHQGPTETPGTPSRLEVASEPQKPSEAGIGKVYAQEVFK